MRPEIEKASVRPAAVAGLFYPSDPEQLRDVVAQYLTDAPVNNLRSTPKALIVPHAGYVYSGPVAAAAYARIADRRNEIRRVVLLGPSHRVYLQGIALPRSDAFRTPLGTLEIDPDGKALLLQGADIVWSDTPHAQEHCLEVQLPFLQMILEEFTVLPLVVGSASPQQVATVLTPFWNDEQTLVLISSDLSHYHDYQRAQAIDRATSEAILRLSTSLSGEQACGAACINGLLYLCRERGLDVNEIARMNSGDTAGDRQRVVGYGAFAVEQREH